MMDREYIVKNYVIRGYGYRWTVYKGNTLIGTYCDTHINLRTLILTGRLK